MPLDAHGFTHQGSECGRMRPSSQSDEIHLAPIFRLDERPRHDTWMRYAVLWHESEPEAGRYHGQNPVVAFASVDHVPCRAAIEKATAIEFAIYTVEIGLALQIRKANPIVHRERMTGMD